MTPQDEQELHRLSEILRSIGTGLAPGSSQREALQKAGLALTLAFTRNLRTEIERTCQELGLPLSDAQRERLGWMAIDPDP